MDARIVITLERDPVTGQPSYTCQLMAFSPADGQEYVAKTIKHEDETYLFALAQYALRDYLSRLELSEISS